MSLAGAQKISNSVGLQHPWEFPTCKQKLVQGGQGETPPAKEWQKADHFRWEGDSFIKEGELQGLGRLKRSRTMHLPAKSSYFIYRGFNWV